MSQSNIEIKYSDSKSEKKKARYEELAVPKLRIDNSIRVNAFRVSPGALTYEITEALTKLAQPKRKYSANTYKYSSPSFLSMPPSLKPESLSKQSSSTKSSAKSQRSDFETYANIAARRISPYPKRLRHFSKSINHSSHTGFDTSKTPNKFSQIYPIHESRNKHQSS